jgi:hypothetical protein
MAPEAGGVAARLDEELQALGGGALLRWVFFAALVVIVAWITAWGIGIAERFVRSVVTDPHRRIRRLAAALRVTVGVVAVFWALRPLFTKAPLVMSVVLLLLVVVGARVAENSVRNLIAGLALARRQSVVEGDLISVGKVEGTVTRIGLWRTLLVDEHGSRRFVPNRSLVVDEITIAATAGVARVRVQLEPPRPPSGARLEEARRALLSSPFREPAGFVAIELAEDGRVHAEMETWASEEAEEIERRLRRRLEGVLCAEEAGTP